MVKESENLELYVTFNYKRERNVINQKNKKKSLSHTDRDYKISQKKPRKFDRKQQLLLREVRKKIKIKLKLN